MWVKGAMWVKTIELFSIKSPALSGTIITLHRVPAGEIKSAGVYIEVTIVLGFVSLNLLNQITEESIDFIPHKILVFTAKFSLFASL
jgi:hypothetical protein